MSHIFTSNKHYLEFLDRRSREYQGIQADRHDYRVLKRRAELAKENNCSIRTYYKAHTDVICNEIVSINSVSEYLRWSPMSPYTVY